MVPQPGKTIKDYKWNKRIVITNFENLSLDSVLAEGEKGIEERKLLFVEFKDDKYIENSLSDELDPAGFLTILSKAKPNSEWVLVGLDGGVKASGKSQDFTLNKIYQLIDQMPMRRSEIDNASNRP